MVRLLPFLLPILGRTLKYVLYLDGRQMTRVKTTNTLLNQLVLEAADGNVKFDRIKLRRAE